MISKLPGSVRKAARRIKQAGGRANLVGGAVIDLLQGTTPKDWDIEVFGLSYERLAEIFAEYNPKLVGAAFGIVTVDIDGQDLDLSVPRRDNKIGIGHKAFSVAFDPTMTPKEAARRRDFTINSMALDLTTGELIDPFGGLTDLQAGILRATDPATFVEDPLRALRAMQLLARKAKVVDPSTMRLIRSMKGTFPTLAKERLLEEFRKLFLKAKKPSVGLEFLRESEWIEHFPELQALIGLDQHPEWHPEGDVWTHSKQAADEAASILHKVKPEFREALAFGVFLHDLGKAQTTVLPAHIQRGLYPKERLFTAWGHDRAGEPLAVEFLTRLGAPNKTIDLVKAIVGEHMAPYALYAGKGGQGGYMRLAKKMQAAGGDLELLGHMSHCDACATGIPHRHFDESKKLPAQRVFDYAAEIANKPSLVQPTIQGRDLIAAGFKPGAAFAPALKAAFEAQMDFPDLTKADLLKIAIEKMPIRAKRNGQARSRSTRGSRIRRGAWIASVEEKPMAKRNPHPLDRPSSTRRHVAKDYSAYASTSYDASAAKRSLKREFSRAGRALGKALLEEQENEGAWPGTVGARGREKDAWTSKFGEATVAYRLPSGSPVFDFEREEWGSADDDENPADFERGPRGATSRRPYWDPDDDYGEEEAHMDRLFSDWEWEKTTGADRDAYDAGYESHTSVFERDASVEDEWTCKYCGTDWASGDTCACEEVPFKTKSNPNPGVVKGVSVQHVGLNSRVTPIRRALRQFSDAAKNLPAPLRNAIDRHQDTWESRRGRAKTHESIFDDPAGYMRESTDLFDKIAKALHHGRAGRDFPIREFHALEDRIERGLSATRTFVKKREARLPRLSGWAGRDRFERVLEKVKPQGWQRSKANAGRPLRAAQVSGMFEKSGVELTKLAKKGNVPAQRELARRARKKWK